MRMLISYDIASQRRRRRVVHLLEGHGHRVQESVFIVDLREAQWRQLAALLDRAIDLRADQWRAWRMCCLLYTSITGACVWRKLTAGQMLVLGARLVCLYAQAMSSSDQSQLHARG